MDEQAALLSRRVALGASAWLKNPTDTGVYERMVSAVADWDDYLGPELEIGSGDAELLDEIADQSPPVLIGDSVPDLEAVLRARARHEL